MLYRSTIVLGPQKSLSKERLGIGKIFFLSLSVYLAACCGYKKEKKTSAIVQLSTHIYYTHTIDMKIGN